MQFRDQLKNKLSRASSRLGSIGRQRGPLDAKVPAEKATDDNVGLTAVLDDPYHSARIDEDLPPPSPPPEVGTGCRDRTETGVTCHTCGTAVASSTALPDDFKSVAQRPAGDSKGVSRPKTAQPPMTEGEKVAYWGPVQHISHDRLKNLANRVVRPKIGGWHPEWQLVQQFNGAFNHSYILRPDSADHESINIRIPACGFHGRWNEVDARLLRDTALGMEWIRTKTGLPVPRLISYDASMDNELDSPYIAMSYIEGIPLTEAWASAGDDAERVKARREKMLRSLAGLVPRFNAARFSSSGALTFESGELDSPSITGAFRLTDDNMFVVKREFFTLPVAHSLREYLKFQRVGAYLSCKEAIEKDHGSTYELPETDDSRSQCSLQGADAVKVGYLEIWERMQDAFLHVASLGPEDDHFVLMQSDFNPQNVLVDADSNVVGLIDWDCLEAVPRQTGWSTVPHWLVSDWHHDWEWPVREGALKGMLPGEFDDYRTQYCRLLKRTCGQDDDLSDHRWTSKSHVYRLMLTSHASFDQIQAFVRNVMVDILPRNVKCLDHLVARVVSQGWEEDEEEWLKERLEDYFAPAAV